MQTIGSRDQFRRDAQSMLQNIEQQLNDLSQANQDENRSVSGETSNEINRLKNQHRNLKEALDKYGSVNEDKWSQVQSEVQSVFDEANSSWEQYRTNPTAASSWGNPTPNSMQGDQEGKYQVSTGQSDRGDAGQMTGMGDRSGMEDNQGKSRAYDDSDTVNNKNGQSSQYEQKDKLVGSEEQDEDENIDEEGGVVGQERGTSNQSTASTWDYSDHAGFASRSGRSGGINQGDQGPAVGNDYSDNREGVKSDRTTSWESIQPNDNDKQPEDTSSNESGNNGKSEYENERIATKKREAEEGIEDSPKQQRPWDSRSM